MDKWANLYFEWKLIDEKVLHYSKPSKIQLIYEISIISIPILFIVVVFLLIWNYFNLNSWTLVLISILILSIWWFNIFYKIYRTRRNYIIITSKRILFHWIKWFFNDYMKKIHYENIVNVNYFTANLIWKFFWYWTLEIQTSHSWMWDIVMYHIENAKNITHYIDKLISLNPEQRNDFGEFNPNYFKEGYENK